MRNILIYLLIIFSISVQAADISKPKQRISGQAVSKNDQKSIPYITITVHGDSSKVVSRSAGDSDGKFVLNLPAGAKYTLTISATGYQSIKKEIESNESIINMGVLSMEQGVEMQAVTVTGQKPLVKVSPDKITYSVESDPESKTSNGLEILRKVPLMEVDGEDNVTLNGQSNFKVLINGKSSSMMSKNFKEVIKSLPANSIKDIEVITNPSTKYESEGIGGIINIITVRKTLNGYNGSASMGIDNWGSVNGYLNLSTRINKLGLSGMYSINQYDRPSSHSESHSENYAGSVTQFSNGFSQSKSNGFSQQFSGELSYEIDTFNLISGSFWGYNSNSNNNSRSVNSIEDINHVQKQYFQSINDGESGYGSVSGNLDFQKTYMKPDKSLTFSYKFDLSPQNNNSYSYFDSTFNYVSYTQKNIRDNISQEHTFQFDFYDPLTKVHQYEWGMKFIYRGNDEKSERWRNDTLREDYSNRLLYDQYILGAYGGYVFKWKKMTAKTGFRLERTWNYGLSKSTERVPFTNKLFNLVPYASISYQLKPTQTFRFSYTQRLQRPSVYYLNPYKENSNPLYVRYGNQDLESERSHSFDLSYSTYGNSFSWNSSLSASINNNSIESVSWIDSLNVTTTTYDNIGLDDRYRWNNYISYRKGSKFNIYASITGSYSRFATNNGMGLSNEGFSYNCYGGFRLGVWKNASFNGNLSYSSPSVYLQGKSKGYSYSSLGFSQYFLDRKMAVSLSVSDPLLEKRTQSGEQKGVGYTSNYSYWSYARSARLNISYNFGKLDTGVKKAKRGISNDDVKSGQ
jgi:outer membrane receptor protein involved in Fe transport